MKISEILRKAADERLSPNEYDNWKLQLFVFSCRAVAEVECGRDVNIPAETESCKFLAKLGINSRSLTEFDEFTRGEIRQGARFLWLDFAALVAEDEGL